MARQLYETEADLARERAVIERVNKGMYEIRKLPIKLRADFGLFDKQTGNLMRWAEVRCRSNPRDKYPTLFMSLEKMLSIAELVNITSKPLSLLVEWTDVTGRFDFKKGDLLEEFDITWGGRGQLRDEQDVEPVMHIPNNKFTILEKPSEQKAS